MPTPLKFKAPFHAESFYHIVCKSIDGILLLRHLHDYEVFMERFRQFTFPFLQIWSYSLLANHTHHVVKVISNQELIDFLENQENVQHAVAMQRFLQNPGNELFLDHLLERQMNSFLVSYANYYNHQYDRKGGLFQKPFRRIEISDDGYLQQAIIYTNVNAQKHKLVNDFSGYPHSSYNDVMKDNDKWIALKDVVSFFGNKKTFEEVHKRQVNYYYQAKWPSSKLE